jgi:hypothetical protein
MKTPLRTLVFGLLLSALASGDVVTLVHPEEVLPPEKTVVWTPVFQAAWDQFNNKMGGPPARVDPPNALMEKLDSFHWDATKVMPDGSWKAWCGLATHEFLTQVNKEAAAITKEPEGPFKLQQETAASLAFFGILDRDVEFQHAFFPSTKTPMKFRIKEAGYPVQFFGVRGGLSEEFSDSIRVLAYRPVDCSLAIQIHCKRDDDTVILYLPPKQQNFATACHWIRTWRSQSEQNADNAGAWNDRNLHAGDEIQIPYVSLESKADFMPLLGSLRYHRNNDTPWQIDSAGQITRFQLHEKGARVRVEAAGSASFSATPPPPIPRHFLYDRPFFVFLWRDQAEWPYFGAWIGDASALKPFP